MVRNLDKLVEVLVERAKELGNGCKKVFVAVSGGVDSSTVAAILCKAYGQDDVVGLYRDIRSNPKHFQDVQSLQRVLGFRLIELNLNDAYDDIIDRLHRNFLAANLPWVVEGEAKADISGFTSAYASLKSCLTTPIASFIAKAIDSGNGRIFGTGNGEEDGLLRYFDKRGDGAVDNNILNGLTKAEVRQIARQLGVPECIITKKPSADLEANGDIHNDEDQLTAWAMDMGYDIRLSYGAPDGSTEGNIAWAWKEDISRGVISDTQSDLTPDQLKKNFSYTDEQVQLIQFLRQIEAKTRHKIEPIPGLDRGELYRQGLVQ